MTDFPRIITFDRGNRTALGLVRDDRVVELAGLDRWSDLRALVESGCLQQIETICCDAPATLFLDKLTLTPPIPSGAKIICVGVNYPDRAEEYQGNSSAPAYPSLFTRFPASLVGHGQPLVRPGVSPQLDYEGEIVLVLGRGGRHIPEDAALECVAAVTLCNEGSVRDWMRHGKFNVTQGKNFDQSGALGPWLVPFRGEAQIADIRLTTRVNGELRQDDRTSRMLFPFRRLIAYISTFTTLEPGDVIITGTPTGAGARRDPPVWLAPGDVVEIEAEGIGILSNTIVDERQP